MRLLCDDPWDGGRGYLGDIGSLTLDQIFMRLADRKVLRAKMISGGVAKTPLDVSVKADQDGMVRGRAADGTAIKGRIRGKSLARQLMEEEAVKATESRQRRRRVVPSESN